jgi:hypothetical protein
MTRNGGKDLAELGVWRACVVYQGEALVTVCHDGTSKRNGVTLLWTWITDLSLVSS